MTHTNNEPPIEIQILDPVREFPEEQRRELPQEVAAVPVKTTAERLHDSLNSNAELIGYVLRTYSVVKEMAAHCGAVRDKELFANVHGDAQKINAALKFLERYGYLHDVVGNSYSDSSVYVLGNP